MPCFPARRVWSQSWRVRPTTLAPSSRARMAATVDESTPPDMAMAMVSLSGMRKLLTSIVPSMRLRCEWRRGSFACSVTLPPYLWEEIFWSHRVAAYVRRCASISLAVSRWRLEARCDDALWVGCCLVCVFERPIGSGSKRRQCVSGESCGGRQSRYASRRNFFERACDRQVGADSHLRCGRASARRYAGYQHSCGARSHASCDAAAGDSAAGFNSDFADHHDAGGTHDACGPAQLSTRDHRRTG